MVIKYIIIIIIYCVLITIYICITQGYEGMVQGGDNIVEATWSSVSGILQMVRFLVSFQVNVLSLSQQSPLI